MKVFIRCIIAIVLSVSPLCAFASRYVVFKVRGDVKILSESGWVVPKKRQPLDIKDRINIGQDAAIGILDKVSKGIFYGSTKGETMVGNIIREAKRQSSRQTSLVVGSLFEGGPSSARASSRKIVSGVSSVLMRGLESDDDNDSISTSKNALWRVLNTLTLDRGGLDSINVRGGLDTVNAGKVSFSRIVDRDSVVSFSVANGADSPLFVNVVRVCSDEAPRFLINGGEANETLVLAPHAKVDVDWVPMLFEPDAEYLLLVTDISFNVMHLQRFMESIHASGRPIESRPSMIDADVWNAPVIMICD